MAVQKKTAVIIAVKHQGIGPGLINLPDPIALQRGVRDGRPGRGVGRTRFSRTGSIQVVINSQPIPSRSTPGLGINPPAKQ